MLRRILVLFAILCTSAHFLHAQKHAYNWYFGLGAGLHFGENSVEVLTDGRNYDFHEACSSISDENRNLLFYSNGFTVYDRNHDVMLNGTNLKGNVPDDVAHSVIIPKPGSDNIYHIFSLDRYPGKLSYSIVDLSRNGGLGEVITKNIIVTTTVTETLSASVHSNGVDYWVTVHEFSTNRFLSFLVSSSGVETIPVISAAGSAHASNPPKQMKVSPDGTMIAVTFQKTDYQNTSLEVFRFNSATGKVGNLIFSISTNEPGILTSLRNLTGLEFSRNGRFIYVTNRDSSGANHIYQFDLRSGDPDTIKQSIFIIGTPLHGLEESMQMGPDGKIYIVYGGGHGWGNLSRINNPNEKGHDCRYVEGDIFLLGKEAILFLPIFIHGDFAEPPAITHGPICLSEAVAFEGTSLGAYDSCIWNFDDPTTLNNNTATSPVTTHKFSHAGTFNVTLNVYVDGQVSKTISHAVIIKPLPAVELGDDKIICEGEKADLVVEEGYDYSWSTGETTASITVNSMGWYEVVVSNGQCSITDRVYVDVLNLPVPALPDEIETCTFPVTLDAKNEGYKHAWRTGQTTPKIEVDVAQKYYVTVSNDLCTVSDSVNVKFKGVNDLVATVDKANVKFKEAVSFHAAASEIAVWYWDFGDGEFALYHDPAYEYAMAGNYVATITVTNTHGCKDSLQFAIVVEPHLFIPNVFTPGNDNANDTFEIQYNGDESYHLQIFNRWGEQIYATSDRTTHWTGYNASTGVYYYHLNIGSQRYKGWVHLVR